MEGSTFSYLHYSYWSHTDRHICYHLLDSYLRYFGSPKTEIKTKDNPRGTFHVVYYSNPRTDNSNLQGW
jgi:hypothetical protein